MLIRTKLIYNMMMIAYRKNKNVNLEKSKAMHIMNKKKMKKLNYMLRKKGEKNAKKKVETEKEDLQ